MKVSFSLTKLLCIKIHVYMKIQNTFAGLPLGQEKSGNQEKSGKIWKNYKSQEKAGKNGGF